MDGFSKCGSRTINVSPTFSWLTVVGDTLTLESNSPSDAPATEIITITVTLDDYPSITDSS